MTETGNLKLNPGGAAEELQAHFGMSDELEYLWKAIVALEGEMFQTSGRGKREGVRFTYTISRKPGSGGRHYDGARVEDYGNELWIIRLPEGEKREKSISRSTVDLGYRKARELGVVKGPKALGLPGSGSYLYPVFLLLGVCNAG